MTFWKLSTTADLQYNFLMGLPEKRTNAKWQHSCNNYIFCVFCKLGLQKCACLKAVRSSWIGYVYGKCVLFYSLPGNKLANFTERVLLNELAKMNQGDDQDDENDRLINQVEVPSRQIVDDVKTCEIEKYGKSGFSDYKVREMKIFIGCGALTLVLLTFIFSII